ncbi:HmuY family protein [Porifericola rhodea]|uniref:HmuY family protein n=1 Tax=Porifericola rhodea TaxID=930972 RepID=UPI0026660346|nr:HmuY family protein [Porifericola rhodea]WKN30255.1 HmuY family protein [Porifericola rhodea]
MKNQIRSLFPVLLSLLLAASACEEEDNDSNEPLTIETATDINGDPERSGNFTFYDLESGQILTQADSNSTEWDLGFSTTTIITNGGSSGPGQGAAQIVNGLFDEVESAPASGYSTDSEAELAIPTGSNNGWYTYTGGDGSPAHAVLPIPGKVIVLKTGEGNYAKVEILSIYKGNPDTTTEEFANLETRAEYGYYTFRYVVQTNGSQNFE